VGISWVEPFVVVGAVIEDAWLLRWSAGEATLGGECGVSVTEETVERDSRSKLRVGGGRGDVDSGASANPSSSLLSVSLYNIPAPVSLSPWRQLSQYNVKHQNRYTCWREGM